MAFPYLDASEQQDQLSRVVDDDLFFVVRNGAIWACWLSGKPAVNLGPEAEVLAALAQFLDARNAGPTSAEAAAPPRPAETGSAQGGAAPAPAAPSRDPPKERATVRHELTISGRIIARGGAWDATILDLSETGCQFIAPHASLTTGTHLTIKIGPIGPVPATVRWQRDRTVGIQFDSPLYPAVLDHIRRHFDIRRQ